MFLTQPAIIRTSQTHLSPIAGRNFPRQRVLIAIKHCRIAANKILPCAVRWAVLAEINTVVTNDNFSLYQPKTFRAQALRDADVVVIAIFQGSGALRMRTVFCPCILSKKLTSVRARNATPIPPTHQRTYAARSDVAQ